jgi:CheY-like chemotaxis protein
MEVTSDRQTVLIVEDEPFLRMDAAEAISAAGYMVVEAGNADEAIAILERRADISIVFTDIDMPGSMDGLKLAHVVRGRWPPIRIIATSGHARVSERDLPGSSRFIPKPYTPAKKP